MNSLDQIVNLKVKITNLLDESLTASIYAFSPGQDILAVKVDQPLGAKGQPRPPVYRIINTSFIKSLQVLPPFPKKGAKATPISNQRLSKVDVKKLEAELNDAVLHYKKPTEHENAKVVKKEAPLAKKDAIPSVKASQAKGANQIKKHDAKKAEVSPVASKIFQKLTSKFGKENVQWHGNESMIIFKEIVVSRPYALNKISNPKKLHNPKQLDEVRSALREIWLEVDTPRRGG